MFCTFCNSTTAAANATLDCCFSLKLNVVAMTTENSPLIVFVWKTVLLNICNKTAMLHSLYICRPLTLYRIHCFVYQHKRMLQSSWLIMYLVLHTGDGILCPPVNSFRIAGWIRRSIKNLCVVARVLDIGKLLLTKLSISLRDQGTLSMTTCYSCKPAYLLCELTINFDLKILCKFRKCYPIDLYDSNHGEITYMKGWLRYS